MQPKINRDLSVIFGRSPALAPTTMLERMYRSQEEVDAEREALNAAHLATLARRAAFDDAQTQGQRDGTAPTFDPKNPPPLSVLFRKPPPPYDPRRGDRTPITPAQQAELDRSAREMGL